MLKQRLWKYSACLQRKPVGRLGPVKEGDRDDGWGQGTVDLVKFYIDSKGSGSHFEVLGWRVAWF